MLESENYIKRKLLNKKERETLYNIWKRIMLVERIFQFTFHGRVHFIKISNMLSPSVVRLFLRSLKSYSSHGKK